jgi:hypothetical protein
MRFNAFFLESCSSLLIYDILWNPSKHAYHLEYVQLALKSMDMMVKDEPVTNASSSLQQILRVVESAIGKQPSLLGPSNSNYGFPADQLNMQFPPAGPVPSTTAEQLIHMSDMSTAQGHVPQTMPISGVEIDGLQSNSHFDVLTTDLHSFFPIDILTPEGGVGYATVPAEVRDWFPVVP